MRDTVEFEIRKKYKEFRPSEKKVADYILRCDEDVSQMTIVKLSKCVGVSQPTILRFANAIGISGFKELKYCLLQDKLYDMAVPEPTALHGFCISNKDELVDVPSNVIATTTKIMQDILKSISSKEYLKLIDKIVSVQKVFVFGVENSGSAVSDLVTKLLYLGINCITYTDYYLQSVCASNLTKNDLAIGISYTGYSKNTVDVMEVAKKSGATTAIITNFENSVISNFADIVITATTEQYIYGDAIFSRTSQLAIVDMIYTGILVSNYNYYTEKINECSKVVCRRNYCEEKDILNGQETN